MHRTDNAVRITASWFDRSKDSETRRRTYVLVSRSDVYVFYRYASQTLLCSNTSGLICTRTCTADPSNKRVGARLAGGGSAVCCASAVADSAASIHDTSDVIHGVHTSCEMRWGRRGTGEISCCTAGCVKNLAICAVQACIVSNA